MLHQKCLALHHCLCERDWSYPTLSEPAIMVCTNVLVLKSKHSQSCYLLSLFPFAQKFCLSFSKVPLSMVRRDRFHKACYCVRGSWDCFVAEIGVTFLVCMWLDTHTDMCIRTGSVQTDIYGNITSRLAFVGWTVVKNLSFNISSLYLAKSTMGHVKLDMDCFVAW